MSDLKTITLKGVELRWACLAEPSTRGEFASNKYQVDVVMNKDDAKLVKELKNSRQVIKDLGDGLFSITLKSTRKPKVGRSAGAPWYRPARACGTRPGRSWSPEKTAPGSGR